MKYVGLGIIIAVGLWTYGRRIRGASHQRPVSRAWLVDDDRRAWGRGIDQSRIAQWPIKKGEHP